MSQITTVPLPEGTVLAGRYVLGNPRAVSEAGIAYNAFDKKLRMPCEVFEFLPIDCAVRRKNGSVASKENTDPKIFEEKCEKLRAGAVQRFQDSSSAIYDLIAANGSVYLVQACAKNNAYPGNAGSADTSVPEEEEDAVTREIGGLFAGGDPSPAEDTSVSEEPTIIFPSELLQDTPEPAGDIKIPEEPAEKAKSPDKQQAKPVQERHAKPAPQPVSKPEAAPKSAPKPDEYKDGKEDDKKLNIKLLAILLAGVVILLVLGVVIFVSVLQQITGTTGESDSLLGIPVVEVAENDDVDYLIVGTGSNTQYAPGMVIAEEQKGDVLHILVNSPFPAYVMPDLSGMTYDSAEALLNRTTFCNAAGTVNVKIQVEEVRDNTYAPGAVVSQSPAANSVVTADTPVTLKIAASSDEPVSDKETQMPDLCGEKYAPVLSGYPLLIRDKVYAEDVPAGTILQQYPSAGEEWVEGGVCYVVVSAGTEVTYVPDMMYCTLEQAREMLYAKGLSVKTEYSYNSNIREGLVSAQSAVGGTEAVFGDIITLTVSGDGKAHSGPVIENNVETVTLRIGDTCTMELDTEHTVHYYSTNPAAVTVDGAGTVTAVGSGSAVITASIDGTTIAMAISVEYPEQKTVSGIAQIDKDFSLSTLVEGEDENWQWTVLQGEGTLSADGVFRTDAAGKVILSGTNGDTSTLVLLTVEDTGLLSVAKDLIKNADSAKKLLEDMGLTCIIEEEYSSTSPEGTVLRIRYSGHSDDKEYHFAAGSAVTLIVSRGELRVASIAILEKPAKLTYETGEKLDTAGLVLAVTYEDGSVQNITSGFATSYDFSSTGRKTVAVSFGDRKASFHVEVIGKAPATLSIRSKPTKTTYYVGESLDHTGLEVQITYGDGTVKVLTGGFLTTYNFGKAGTAEVKVILDTLSTSFTVTVLEKKVEYLELLRYPDKLSYYAGETFDATGMQLRAYYANDSLDVITSGWTIDVDMESMMGDCPVTVNYGGKSVSFMITVRGLFVENIAVQKAPVKTEYLQGEEIDLTGLVLTAVYENNTTQTVEFPDSSITCTYDFSTAGEKSVTVKYMGKECTFRVLVKPAKLLNLMVHTLPDKMVYMSGEKLDTAGLVLMAEYENDIRQQITSGYTYSYDFSAAGDAKVRIFFEDLETSFYVTVIKDELLYTTPDSLDMQVGESEMLRIYSQLSDQTVRFSVSDSSVISVKSMGSTLVVTALAPGEAAIQLESGTYRTECKVRVSDTQTDEPFTAELTVTEKGDQYFEKTLVFTGSDTKDVTVEFTARVSYDSSKIVMADYVTANNGVTMQYDGSSSFILSGKITIPKGVTVAAAHFTFLGTDTSACVLSIQ
ncbi:MAG: bacterial Ig-like domain-containing protein [Clostridia bacterium]|nr:bacterial Ig-like domain-containing protein [Clostridia bacterium]